MNEQQYRKLIELGFSARDNDLQGFAAACYGTNSAQELIDALADGPDVTDMKDWGIGPTHYNECVFAALEAMMFDFECGQPA